MENSDGAGAFFKYSNLYQDQSWFKNKEVALKAVENSDGAKIFFTYSNQYQDQSWFKDKEVALKAVENSDGAGAFFKNIEKYKNESWVIELVKSREVVEKLTPKDFFNYLREDTYLNEDWVEKLALKVVENRGGAIAFFKNIEKYKSKFWAQKFKRKREIVEKLGDHYFFE